MQKMSGRYNTVDMSSLLTTCIGLTRVISISILTLHTPQYCLYLFSRCINTGGHVACF